MKEKVVFSWSGGKDSARALYEIKRSGNYEVAALLTTVTADFDRISMHGVPRILLEQQARSLGVPLEKFFITKGISNEEYESKMRVVLEKYLARGVKSVVCGDIFLEDLKKYREDNLAKIGMKGIFPIWKQDSRQLALSFIKLGFKAIVTCVDSSVMGKEFSGRAFDEDFLSDLPSGVDPCGENGEFHSFVYDGPIFAEPLSFIKGGIVLRDNRYYFCDLIPSLEGAPAKQVLAF